MTAETYKTRAGVTRYRPVMTMDEYAAHGLDDLGFCLGCGAAVHGVEPDARQYECEICGAKKVYGLEELLVMGLVKLKD